VISVRLLHVYSHLIFRALEYGILDEFKRLGLNPTKYYCNQMIWEIICVHTAFYELDLTFYELDLIG